MLLPIMAFQTRSDPLPFTNMPLRNAFTLLFISTALSSTTLWFMIDAAQTEAGPVGDAASAVAARPFGGQHIVSTRCSCGPQNCTAVQVGLPTPATTALFCEGQSILYREYSILAPGAWDLGQTVGAGSCEFVAPWGCGSVPVQGIIYHVGTSFPAGAGI